MVPGAGLGLFFQSFHGFYVIFNLHNLAYTVTPTTSYNYVHATQARDLEVGWSGKFHSLAFVELCACGWSLSITKKDANPEPHHPVNFKSRAIHAAAFWSNNRSKQENHGCTWAQLGKGHHLGWWEPSIKMGNFGHTSNSLQTLLVGGLEHNFDFSIQLGMSSSQLTFLFFRGLETCHQPDCSIPSSMIIPWNHH